MSEVRFAVGDADADLQKRLGKEIGEFNAAAMAQFEWQGFGGSRGPVCHRI